MSRLIDADDLIEYIKIWDIGNSISSDQKEFIDCVNRQFTAFNVDKVVEQIEHRRANFDCKLCKYNDDEKTICSEDCSDALIDDLIKIVKEGGLNERNSFQGKAGWQWRMD
jgi:hypothetical protein|uniref:hypothetical protein n=1 Tax=Phocaeicola vulgatus TaxID=821 RepID=UPI003FEFF72D